MFSLLFRHTTRRLMIRRMVPGDWEDLYEYLSDPETVLYEPYEPYSRADAQLEAANRANSPSFLAVCLLTNGKMIGNLYVSPEEPGSYEIGYVFNRRYWGKGYAFESSEALMDILWSHIGTKRIFAECDARNTRSFALMERLGMMREKEFMGKDFTGREKKALCYRYGISRQP